MTLRFFKKRIHQATMVLVTLGTSTLGLSVTQYKKIGIPYTTNSSQLRSSITPKTIDRKIELTIPYKKLKARAKKFSKDERVDPVQVYVPRNEREFNKVLKKVSKKRSRAFVRSYFQEKLDKASKKKDRVLVDLDKSVINKVKLRPIGKIMSRTHHNVKVDVKALNEDTKTRKELLGQMKLFLKTRQRVKIARKLKSEKDLSIHKDLLPEFARKMAKKYVVFRGPNCFHAALAFHGQKLTKSSFVNVKKEKGYHRAMINYDELWRAINRHFYEVDTSKSSLKYGDMLVFFNIPSKKEMSVNFRWIRHTATYLFGEYTFSKGSKSPNTPYSVKTLNEEWSTWDKYTKKLGVRVYRRVSRQSARGTPKDLTDWIF